MLQITAGQHVTIGSRGVNINGDGDVDLISSRLAEITVFLNNGDDTLTASGGHGTGDAYLPPRWGLLAVNAGGGDDALSGTGRGDLLDGESGFDVIRGRGGPDELWGDGETDEIWGGMGNDYIDPGPWPDTVHAGPGDDFLSARDLEADELAGGTGFDRARVDPNDSLRSIERTLTGD
jgi:Ca2+-binding RTX toxin-like protein